MLLARLVLERVLLVLERVLLVLMLVVLLVVLLLALGGAGAAGDGRIVRRLGLDFCRARSARSNSRGICVVHHWHMTQ